MRELTRSREDRGLAWDGLGCSRTRERERGREGEGEFPAGRAGGDVGPGTTRRNKYPKDRAWTKAVVYHWASRLLLLCVHCSWGARARVGRKRIKNDRPQSNCLGEYSGEENVGWVAGQGRAGQGSEGQGRGGAVGPHRAEQQYRREELLARVSVSVWSMPMPGRDGDPSN